MGNSKYLDSLSSEEYKSLTRKLWTIQNHRCFICGEEIDLDLNPTNIVISTPGDRGQGR